MKPLLNIALVLGLLSMQSCTKAQDNPQIDYKAFSEATKDLEKYRETRLITIEKFNEMAKDINTIILDTRSEKAFDDIHIKGAVHLNFSDFNTKTLAEIIPNKNTRILIYCNNNFVSARETLMMKSAPLALNIPTFINLCGYGYNNVYELGNFLDESDERLDLELREVKGSKSNQ